MTYKLLNAIFLVAGTAIGAGLIALPITAINLGTHLSNIIMLLMASVAYHSANMLIRLDASIKQPLSIIELSKQISGNIAFTISLISFYLLSCALLTVYFCGMEDCLKTFLQIDRKLIIAVCGISLWITLNLTNNLFAHINSLLFTILLIVIISIVLQICCFHPTNLSIMPIRQSRELLTFLPIAFTSFGIQNICAYLYEYLQQDRKQIKIALAVGIAIPTIVYIMWILCIFTSINAYGNYNLLKQLQDHMLSAGQLVDFLCRCSKHTYLEYFFKSLTITAIATSAIGIGLGLLHSIQSSLIPSKTLASAIICLIPVTCAICIPNAFIRILSLGGVIAVVWVIFMPYYLIKKQQQHTTLGDKICLILGIMIVLCECLTYLISV